MNSTPGPHRPTAPATPKTTPTAAQAAATPAAIGRATGILMALVPCTADTARRIFTHTARAVGASPRVMAEAVAALHTDDHVPPGIEQALRLAIDHAQAPPVALPQTAARLLPNPYALRQHLNHLRASRRRTLAAPDDPAARNQLDDAAYTLCVLMGQRSTHAALQAAEEHLAEHRLAPS